MRCGPTRDEARCEESADAHVDDRGHATCPHPRDALCLPGRLDPAGRVAQHEVTQPLRRMDSQPLADHAAQRHAAIIELCRARGIGHCQHVTGQQLHVVLTRWRIRRTVAARVDADHTKEVGQPGHHGIPQRMIGAQ